MARRDEGSNPFWWVILGFICGVVATLGALIAYSGRFDSVEETPAAVESPADEGFGDEAPSDPPSAAPSAAPPSAPPVAEPDSAAPSSGPPPVLRPAAPVDDPQIAEDAAASGMTTRSPRN